MLREVRGVGSPKLQGSHGTGQHPQHCQHHPQDADDAGEWGIGGGVAQGLVHIYVLPPRWLPKPPMAIGTYAYCWSS